MGLTIYAYLAYAAEELATTKKNSEQGDSVEQLGMLLLDALFNLREGVPVDDAEAVNRYSNAAEQGEAKAQLILGRMYAIGEGVPKDDVATVHWISKSGS